ncbi:MAG: DUF885 family protein [Acidobacteriota bacterium]
MDAHRIAVAWLVWTGVFMTTAAPQAAPTGDSAKLRALFHREWEHTLRDDPVFASLQGDARYGDRWRDESLAAYGARREHAAALMAELDGIDPAGLSETDRLNKAIFRKQQENAHEQLAYRTYLLPVNQMDGIQNITETMSAFPFRDLRDYHNWLARLESFPAFMDQTILMMREGMRLGLVYPKVIMERVPDQIAAQIVDDPTTSRFFEPFKKMPETIPAVRRERIVEEARRAIAAKVIPAYRKFATFFDQEYLPACTEKVGVWQLPRGKPMYVFLARKYTTTDLTPEKIHQIGLDEVARIHAEMEKTIRKTAFEGDFQAFLRFLRTSPQFYDSSPEELLKDYRALSRRIDPQLVRLFKRLPRIPYGVEPIPDNIAPDTTTAYYREPAADGSRAGTYFVNLYRPEVRPKYEMEALSLHESVPGHHLQIALAMEQKDLPDFRRYTGFTAFVEGWGLYAESLGEELGFYQDPYSKFGQLTYEMWRAVRLVVDTGIHYLGWTRQEAIDFFAKNAAKTKYDITNEIDRYIAWPGQALAYKIGELKIKQLRARAEKALGDRFDVRDFHDVVLRSGAVPLDILEQDVDTWIADQRRLAGD